jgi:hypothetical protein
VYTYAQIRASDRVLAAICSDSSLSLEAALGAEVEDAEEEADAALHKIKVCLI